MEVLNGEQEAKGFVITDSMAIIQLRMEFRSALKHWTIRHAIQYLGILLIRVTDDD